jgi:hypothetical protein
MSNVVRLAAPKGGNAVSTRGPDYPRQNPAEVLEAEIKALYEIRGELYGNKDERKLALALERAAPLLTNYAGDLRREIEKALAPATIDEIRKHIVLLLDSNPRAQRLTESFGDLVESDIGSLQPSRGAIEAACRSLRVTPRPEFKPVPDIPEIIEAVKAKQMTLEMSLRALDGMPKSIDEARTTLAREREHRESFDAGRRATIRKFLAAGPEAGGLGLSMFDKDLVERVKAELEVESAGVKG